MPKRNFSQATLIPPDVCAQMEYLSRENKILRQENAVLREYYYIMDDQKIERELMEKRGEGGDGKKNIARQIRSA